MEVIIIKDAEIHIRLSKKDKEKIIALAKKSKLNISDYPVKSSINANTIVEANKSEGISELRRIGNNINQITRNVNQGLVREIDLKKVKQELNKIWQLLS